MEFNKKDVQRALQSIINSMINNDLFTIGKVKDSADAVSKGTIDVVDVFDEKVEHSSVRIVSSDNEGIIIEPENDSEVVMVKINAERHYVLTFGKIKSYTLKTTNGQLVIDKEGAFSFENTGAGKIVVDKNGEITLNDGSKGGLVISGEVADKIKNLEEKYNALAQKWNTFCSSYIPGSPSTTGLPATLSTSTVVTISPTTQKSDLENTKVKHGT